MRLFFHYLFRGNNYHGDTLMKTVHVRRTAYHSLIAMVTGVSGGGVKVHRLVPCDGPTPSLDKFEGVVYPDIPLLRKAVRDAMKSLTTEDQAG